MVTYTDQYKAIKDEIKSLITGELSRFQRHDALIERNTPQAGDFGREEVIRLAYGSTEPVRNTSDTVVNEYPIIVTYYKKATRNEQDTMSDVIERLQQLFFQNRATDNWHYLLVSTDHNPAFESGRGDDPGELTDDGEPLPNLEKIEMTLTIFAQISIN